MRLRLLVPLVALPVLALPAGAAAAPSYPSISKVSPLKLGVGDTLTIKGKQFRSGAAKNTVVFQRNGGRAVFVKAGASTKTRITVVIPAKLLTQMTQKAGAPKATRFRVRVLSKRLGKRFTTLKASPMIGPVGTQPKATAADCDADQVPNAKDLDDDNDLLSDAVEAEAGTDPCKPDTDGDGMSDGWEQASAIDYNGKALPSPKKRPYPNALNAEDAAIDSDGDALPNLTEYTLWAAYGNRSLPLNFSGGDPATGGKKAPAPSQRWFDRDRNGFLSDNERDGDGDGIPNQDEFVSQLVVQIPILGFLSQTYIDDPDVHRVVDFVPLYGALEYTHKVVGTDATDGDSDGDGVNDGADDQDGDGFSNVDEVQDDVAFAFTESAKGTTVEDLKAKTKHYAINACEPDPSSRMCVAGDSDIDRDGKANRDDDDIDDDLIRNEDELGLDLNPYKADTDLDGVGDGFEYYSAIDLNARGAGGPPPKPYPSKQPYPNALDPSDANIDFDGDALTSTDEYRAWHFTEYAGLTFIGDRSKSLTYSEGSARSRGAFTETKLNGCAARNASQTVDSDKDVDCDELSNIVETHGALSSRDYWPTVSKSDCSKDYVESVYPGPKYEGLSFVDGDSDGDGLLDGEDDTDHDGVSNLFESDRSNNWCLTYTSVGPMKFGKPTESSGTTFSPAMPAMPAVPADPGADPPTQAQPAQPARPAMHFAKYARVDAFNPCKPVYSDACHVRPPVDYYVASENYTEDWQGDEPDPGGPPAVRP